jgi:hypothetical protein
MGASQLIRGPVVRKCDIDDAAYLLAVPERLLGLRGASRPPLALHQSSAPDLISLPGCVTGSSHAPGQSSADSSNRNRSRAASWTSRIRAYDPIEPGLNRCNIFVDFLAREGVMETICLNSDGEPLTVHQHGLEGPAVVEPDIRIDNLLDGTRH